MMAQKCRDDILAQETVRVKANCALSAGVPPIAIQPVGL
jgi:hypothetical protein